MPYKVYLDVEQDETISWDEAELTLAVCGGGQGLGGGGGARRLRGRGRLVGAAAHELETRLATKVLKERFLAHLQFIYYSNIQLNSIDRLT